MGLFDKLKEMAKDKAVEALDGLKDQITDSLDTSKQSTPKQYGEQSSYQDNEDVYDEEELEEEELEEEEEDDEEEDNVEYDVVDDEDFDQLNEMVDDAISDGELDDDDREELYAKAEQLNIDMEEFQQMVDARLIQMQEAIENNYDQDYYYHTRSVWRRCPNCGHLNFVDDDYCDWCGYPLRTHPVASAIALGLMAATSNDRKRIKQEKAVRKAAAKKSGIRKPKKTSKTSLAHKSTITHKPSAPAKKSLFGSNNTSTTPAKKSLFGSSKPVEPKKKSLFGSDSSKKSSGLFGSSSSSKKSGGLFGSSSSSKKSGGLFGSSSSSSTPKKSSGGLFGSSSKKSGGLLGGIGKKRR